MSDLNQRFQTAVQESKGLSTRPDNDTLLKLYALYKQATAGDVEGKRPGFTDFKGRAKFDAWAEIAGPFSECAQILRIFGAGQGFFPQQYLRR